MSVSGILERQLAALNARDPDAVAADFAPDSAYWSPTLPDPDLAGPKAARVDAAMLFTAFPDFTLTERGRVEGPDGTAALWWDVAGTFRGPLDPPGFAPTNAPVTNHGVTWVETADAHITRLHLYFDVNELIWSDLLSRGTARRPA